MMRTVLLAGRHDRQSVLDYLLTDAEPTEAELRLWLFGADDLQPRLRLLGDGTALVALPPPNIDSRGVLITLRGADAERPIGAGWTYDGGAFHPPPPPPRVVSGAEFVALFTAIETAQLLAIPELAQAALATAAQNSANLASPRLAALMQLAVARGALSRARADQVLQGVAAPA